MGYMAHNAVVFSTWKETSTFGAEARAVIAATVGGDLHVTTDQWLRLFVEAESVVNFERSYCFLPDGSKEGWDTSDLGDEIRAALIDLADKHGIDWIEVRFGGDDPDAARMLRANDFDDDDERAATAHKER